MKSTLAKPLHRVAGRPMLAHVIAAAESLSPEKIVVVVGDGMDDVAQAAHPHPTAIQSRRNGTGGAALAASSHLKGFDGDVLILFGDTPLVTAETMKKMVSLRASLPGAGLVFSGMRVTSANSYGRMVVGDDGFLERIVEFRDASEPEKSITLCNGGIVGADGKRRFDWLPLITDKNAQGEIYLTDLPAIAAKEGVKTAVLEVGLAEMEGVNSRADLARVEAAAQEVLRKKHMLGGVTLIDPASVYFSYDTAVGQDVIIEPGVFFGPGVEVSDNVRILSHCRIEGAKIGTGAEVGPFARLRPGTVVGAGVKIGNFVETKNAQLGPGAKAGHLAYLGDAVIGAGANIGAGAITCNYDGTQKHKTIIGEGAFIGSNAALVAPVTVGEGAVVGAGSTIVEDVPAHALALARGRQVNKAGRNGPGKKKEKRG